MREEFTEESVPSTAGPVDPAPPAGDGDEQVSTADKPPLLPLIAAGLSVFNGILGLGLVALWIIDGTSALSVIQTLAGVCILLGLSAIVVGCLVLNSNRRTGKTMPGSGWARGGIISGLFLLGVTVLLPLISALTVLVGSQS